MRHTQGGAYAGGKGHRVIQGGAGCEDRGQSGYFRHQRLCLCAGTLVEDRLFRVALRKPEQQQEVFLFMERRGPALRDTGVYGLHLQPPAQDGPPAPQRIGLHGPCHAAIQGRQQCEHYLIIAV